jgi:phage terminase large subunit-like protein
VQLEREDKENLLELLTEKENRVKYNYISTLFPDEGPTLPGCINSISRRFYPKHIEFLNAGADFTERAFIAGNRTGKSLTGLYEMVVHCTGLYPSWWKGKRFDRPVTCWLAGDRGEIIRDSLQKDLLGSFEPGTGLIPKHLLVDTSALQGTTNGVGTYFIRHVSGRVSTITVKTYQAGKEAFEAARIDVVMLDEECPLDIYVECQMRTLTTGGVVYLTFTPDSGLTETVLHFLDRPKPGEPIKFVAMIGWDDVPHLAEEAKKKMLATIPAHLRDVKSKGLPYLGAGAIFPIPESEILVTPFKIPDYWPRTYAFDPSWNKTAALWVAYDQETDCLYLYDEYYRGQAEPEIHAAAIKGRGDWMHGIADPHGSKNGRGVSKESFLEIYEKYGLELTLAEPSGPGSVEIGITEVYSRLSTGRLKVFSNLQHWLYEYRIYRRDDKGKVVATNNHLMDDTRYIVLNFLKTMTTYEEEHPKFIAEDRSYLDDQRSQTTGY